MYGDLALTALSRLLLAALSGLLALLAGLLLPAAALLSALAALLSALLATLAALLATLAALLLAGLLFVRVIHGYSLVLPLQPTTNPRRLSSCAAAAGEDAGARASRKPNGEPVGRVADIRPWPRPFSSRASRPLSAPESSATPG